MRRVVPEDSRSIGELFKDLRDQLTLMFRQEVELAKTEMTDKAQAFGRHSAVLAAGAGLSVLAALTLTATVCVALSMLLALFMPLAVAVWLGPLIVTLVLGVAAAVLINRGMKQLQSQRMKPEQTTASLEENKRWLQEKLA